MTTLQPDDSGLHDAPKEYEYEVGDFKVIAQRQDPYGFFYLKQSKGKLPEKFSGAYTSTYEVERAIRDYTHELKKEKSA